MASQNPHDPKPASGMDAARWERVQELFHLAADLPSSERTAFLARECRSDAELHAQVASLLDEDARGASLLDRDVAHVAHEVLREEAPTSLPSDAFGPYRITKVLGEGGMGVVYLGERSDLGSFAAIKILRDAWLSPARRERFASEQRTLAQLNHPSIARLYDANTLPNGTPWFVMEFVEGVPLTEYCRTHQSSVAERLRLFREVCEAVEHAHRHLVIHRDLKPSNILVRADGTVKLLDFGIAKQLESLETPADQTRTGLRLMTPAYAAPEQIRGDRVGIHTDVYSLGVVLYELIVGRLPFDLSNRTPGEAETIIVEQEPDKPSVAARASGAESSASTGRSLNRTLWADLDVLCLTAMHKEPQRRYRTVEALIRDVDHYLGGEPLEARPDSVRYRLGKFVRRNQRSVSAAALVLVTVVGLVVFYTVRLAGARNAAVAEATRTQRIQRFMLNLFQGGDEAVGPADSLRVITLLDRGVQEARSLDGELAVQTELFETLGGLYQKLGNLDRADTLLRTALDQRKSLLGPSHPDIARALVALGGLRSAQAQFEEAEKLAREGLAMTRRTHPPDHPDVARAATALGQVLEERGTYDEAIQVLEEAVRLQSASGKANADLASSITELGNTHFYAGHYDAADTLFRRVLAMSRELYGDRHPLVANDLINVGAVQFERGNNDEAEKFYRQALDINVAWYGKDHHKTASNLTMLGRALIRQNRHDQAVDLLRQALAIRERVFGKMHPQVASTVNELGTIALQREKFDEAEASYSRMVDIYRNVYHDKHYLISIAMANLASVHFARKEYPRAEQLFRESIRRYGETLSPDNLNVGIARIKLGRTLLREGRFRESETELTAGYEIVKKQTSPSVSWLQAARKDLVAVYDSLDQPEKAARLRAEIMQTDGKPAGAAKPK